MVTGRLIDNNWQKENRKLISEIQTNINQLNQERLKGLITDEECFKKKPTCIFQDKKHIIVGYSFDVGNHRYLKLNLKSLEEMEYCTIFAYHLDPESIKVA